MSCKAKDELVEYSSEESNSEDDEDGWKLTDEVEKEFYKTLSQIKNKDPKIYKKDVEFFKDVAIPETNTTKTTKVTPITLRDYERKIITEKGGELSDEEPSLNELRKQPTYVEEQESLKKSFKAVLHAGSDDDSDEAWGGLFKRREKSLVEKEEEEEYYKEWLKGQKNNAPDEEVEKDMKPLRDYWTNPDLDQQDQFLRDYVLNKKYLGSGDKDSNKLDVDDVLEESGDENESQDKHSHRFEPDMEFIKRYPRTMEHTARLKNDHRKKKREEVKERKLKEKDKKRAEIRNKKKQKRKEIENKIEELKKLTGNDQLAFENVLNQDFDLDEHDQAMQRLFNEEFYNQDDPNFNPTNSATYGDTWNEEEEIHEEYAENAVEEPLNCEDPNFNMDCDFDPTKVQPKDKSSRSRRRKDKHRRTTVSEAISQEKPTFNPMVHKSFQEYVDQYYAIDCEDFVGDLACRFKYRRTTPNSYGLSVEEILAADPKELERWCSIKRIHQLRPEVKEKGDVKVYKKKAADEELKRKILPSLYKKIDDEELNPEDEIALTSKDDNMADVNRTNSNNSKNKSNPEKVQSSNLAKLEIKQTKNQECNKKENVKVSKKRKGEVKEAIYSKKKKLSLSENNQRKQPNKHNKNKTTNKFSNRGKPTEESTLDKISDARLLAYGIKPKKFRNKLKYNKKGNS